MQSPTDHLTFDIEPIAPLRTAQFNRFLDRIDRDLQGASALVARSIPHLRPTATTTATEHSSHSIWRALKRCCCCCCCAGEQEESSKETEDEAEQGQDGYGEVLSMSDPSVLWASLSNRLKQIGDRLDEFECVDLSHLGPRIDEQLQMESQLHARRQRLAIIRRQLDALKPRPAKGLKKKD